MSQREKASNLAGQLIEETIKGKKGRKKLKARIKCNRDVFINTV